MLMFAKFVPGLATLAAPVAGENGMSLPRFLFFDDWREPVATGVADERQALRRCLKRDPNLLDFVGRFSDCCWCWVSLDSSSCGYIGDAWC